MKRRESHNKRGFALLFIVMVVAIVAVAAAALLDIVDVDLLIVGEHRRSAIAEAVAEGAIKEIQADILKAPLLPTSDSPNMEVRYAAIDVSGDFVRDPDGLAGGPLVLDEVSSAYVSNNSFTNASLRQGYTAQLRLLRTGPPIGSGLNTVKAVVYEIRARSSVNSGQATDDVLAETFIFATAQRGTVGQAHAR